jgi:hypothetical protein
MVSRQKNLLVSWPGMPVRRARSAVAPGPWARCTPRTVSCFYVAYGPHARVGWSGSVGSASQGSRCVSRTLRKKAGVWTVAEAPSYLHFLGPMITCAKRDLRKQAAGNHECGHYLSRIHALYSKQNRKSIGDYQANRTVTEIRPNTRCSAGCSARFRMAGPGFTDRAASYGRGPTVFV